MKLKLFIFFNLSILFLIFSFFIKPETRLMCPGVFRSAIPYIQYFIYVLFSLIMVETKKIFTKNIFFVFVLGIVMFFVSLLMINIFSSILIYLTALGCGPIWR